MTTKLAAGFLILVFALGGVISAFFSPDTDLSLVLKGPELFHPFGFDSLGRDLFLRSLEALYSSMILAICASLVTGLLGFSLGALAGLRGSSWDLGIMRTIDVLEALPDLLLSAVLLLTWRVLVGDVSVFMQFLGLTLALGFTGWMELARQMRALTLRERNMPYIEAAVALGAGRVRIVTKHMWPNIQNSLLLMLLLQIPGFVLFEATLSFFGLGLQSPQISLGQVLLEGWKLLSLSSHVILGPTALLFLSLVAFQCLLWPTKLRGLASLRKPLRGSRPPTESHDPVPRH